MDDLFTSAYCVGSATYGSRLFVCSCVVRFHLAFLYCGFCTLRSNLRLSWLGDLPFHGVIPGSWKSIAERGYIPKELKYVRVFRIDVCRQGGWEAGAGTVVAYRCGGVEEGWDSPDPDAMARTQV